MRIDITIALHHEEDVDEFIVAFMQQMGNLEEFNFLYTLEEKGADDASAS
jgi:hypothetical protein